MYPGRIPQTFRRHVLPSYSGSLSKPIEQRAKIKHQAGLAAEHIPDYTVLHPKRQYALHKCRRSTMQMCEYMCTKYDEVKKKGDSETEAV
jgi:hypothetical protein